MQKYQAIPQELRILKNWVCWQAVKDERSHSGVSKRPIDPKTGNFAKSNDPSTWADFDTAAAASKNWSGIGFMFGGSGYFGVDLDDINEELREYSEGKENIVTEFVNTLGSYAEASQSGAGIHIICKGALPKGGRRKGKVEMYDTGRFFVMTGQPISEYAEIVDCSDSIKALHEKYIGGGKEPVPEIHHVSIPQTTDEVIKAAINSKNGSKFKALFSGDISGYGSQSEADMAFCNMLAFWTGCDAQKMDAIFRVSGLMREKWDRSQSGSTYGALTLQKAIADCAEVYRGKGSGSYHVNIGSSDNGLISIGEKPERQRLYSFDDTGNAMRFVDLFGDKVRYNYTDKRWIYYDGRKWCTDLTGTVKRLADKSVEAMEAEAQVYAEMDEEEGGDMTKAFQKHVKASRSNRSKRAMLDEVTHYVPVLPQHLDTHKIYINTPAGVIDLRDGTLHDHAPEQYITKITSVEYSPNADCPKWLSFLDDIFMGDKDLIRYIQKAVGYSLTGSTSEQCVFFLFGTGRNGKSTFIDVIRDIVGDYAANIQPETIMVRKTGGNVINSDIARLKGARLVTSVEPNEGMRINEGLLKQLTGDDVVTARKLYGDEFEFKPEFKLWVSTNHKPIIRGTDTGIWRRIHLIPFTVQIPENKIDRRLKYKLAAEMPGIFRWAVDGCLMYQREGLKMPRAVADSVKEYRREMDVISAFIEDCCVTGKGCSVQSSQLYAAYCKWSEQGNEYTMSATKFSVEVGKRFERVRLMKGTYFNGLTLA